MFIALAFDLKTRRSLGDKMAPIRPLMWAFYASAVLIIVRSIFRTIGKLYLSLSLTAINGCAAEFSTISFEAEVQQGYAITHEWMFYVFDSLLILVRLVFWKDSGIFLTLNLSKIATVVFNWIHPSNYLPSRKGLRMDGTTYEVKKFRLFRHKRYVLSANSLVLTPG
jgi:hypothetical protein